MSTRRKFIKSSIASSALLGVTSLPGFAAVRSTPQTALVMDAMGELRNVYSKELMADMIGSGLNSITVTLCDPKSWEDEARQVAEEGILSYDRFITSNPNQLLKATSLADLNRARDDGKLAVFYLFQNSTQFGHDLDSVDIFYSLGVRSTQITYNFQNWAGAGCKERTGAGLTHFGMGLVEKLNETKMLIDLSHANPATMKDTIQASKVPVVISHTGCMTVHENERNTTDECMKLLANRGGLIGICQIRPFITHERKGAFEHYLDHIQHAIKTVGADHVCIGSDRDHRVVQMSEEYLAELKAEEGANFNEAEWPLYMEKLNGPRRMEVIWDGLKGRGLSERELEKVMGTNLYRVYEEVL